MSAHSQRNDAVAGTESAHAQDHRDPESPDGSSHAEEAPMSEPTHHVTRGVLEGSDAQDERDSWVQSRQRTSASATSRTDEWETDAPRTSTWEVPPETDAEEANTEPDVEAPAETTARMESIRDAERAPIRSRGLSESQRARVRTWLNPITGVWIGLVLVAAGFVAIFYSWGKVAGVINVAQQMPYLVSGGITGLALVIVGVTVVDVGVRRQDSQERRHQLLQITRTLDELREVLDGEQDLPQEWED